MRLIFKSLTVDFPPPKDLGDDYCLYGPPTAKGELLFKKKVFVPLGKTFRVNRLLFVICEASQPISTPGGWTQKFKAVADFCNSK